MTEYIEIEKAHPMFKKIRWICSARLGTGLNTRGLEKVLVEDDGWMVGCDGSRLHRALLERDLPGWPSIEPGTYHVLKAVKNSIQLKKASLYADFPYGEYVKYKEVMSVGCDPLLMVKGDEVDKDDDILSTAYTEILWALDEKWWDNSKCGQQNPDRVSINVGYLRDLLIGMDNYIWDVNWNTSHLTDRPNPITGRRKPAGPVVFTVEGEGLYALLMLRRVRS